MPYIGKIQEQLIYDNKTRYKTNDFKPIINICKISKGCGIIKLYNHYSKHTHFF